MHNGIRRHISLFLTFIYFLKYIGMSSAATVTGILKVNFTTEYLPYDGNWIYLQESLLWFRGIYILA